MHMAYRQPLQGQPAPELADAPLTLAQKKAKLEQEKKSKMLSVRQFTAVPEHERFNDAVVRAHGRFVKSGLGENRKEAERFNRQLDKAQIRLRGNTYTPEGNLAGGLVGGAAGAIASYKINPNSLPLSLALGVGGGLVGAGIGGLIGSRVEKKHKTYPNGVKFSMKNKNTGAYATALKELSAKRQRVIEFAKTLTDKNGVPLYQPDAIPTMLVGNPIVTAVKAHHTQSQVKAGLHALWPAVKDPLIGGVVGGAVGAGVGQIVHKATKNPFARLIGASVGAGVGTGLGAVNARFGKEARYIRHKYSQPLGKVD